MPVTIMLWRKLFLIFQASLLGFEIQLKSEQRNSIINISTGELIAILPTVGDTEKLDLSIIHYRQIKACYMSARAGIENFL
jgi:hypothetical protein